MAIYISKIGILINICLLNVYREHNNTHQCTLDLNIIEISLATPHCECGTCDIDVII